MQQRQPQTGQPHRLASLGVLVGGLLLCGTQITAQAPDPSGTAYQQRASVVPAASELPPADPDVIAQEAHPFGHAELGQLVRDGRISIEADSGRRLQILLVATRNTPRGEVLDISVDGLPGTITRRGSAFFASLPSRSGAIRLENQGQSTRLLEERFLDQRNLPGLTDFLKPTAQPSAPGK